MKFLKDNLAIIAIACQLLFGVGQLYLMNNFVTREEFAKHTSTDATFQGEINRSLQGIERTLAIMSLYDTRLMDHEQRVRALETSVTRLQK